MNFHLLTNYLDSLDEEYGVKGLDCLVFKDHELVYRRMVGHSDHEGTKPVSEKDRYYFFSCTKVMTMAAMMQLIEQGKASLYDPVCKYLPEWENMTVMNADWRQKGGQAFNPHIDEPSHFAKRQVRIIDCMSMTAGLTYDMHSDAIQALLAEKPDASTREVVAAMAKMPLLYEPGTHYQYSLGHDVIAAVIEAVSGERYSDYLQDHLFGPLGVTELTMHPTEEEMKDFAAMYRYNPETKWIEPIPMSFGFRVTPNYESGGASLTGTANGYAAVADAIANGGVGKNGVRILKEETVMLFTHSVLTDDMLQDFRVGRFLEYSYGLGVRVKVDPMIGQSPVGEFGWDGAAGAYVVIDPMNHVCIFYAQHVMGFFDVYGTIHPRVRDLVYKGLNRD